MGCCTAPLQSAPVTLVQMLERREARVAAQQALRARHGRTLLQLTLVNPGPVKDSAAMRYVFQQGLAALDQRFATVGMQVLVREAACHLTGPEALWVLSADALALKREAIALEEGHPLGRLWDVDVIGADGRSISRQQLGLPPRTCLLCDQPAHVCSRNRSHALADLQRAIQDRIDAHRNPLAD